MNVDDAVSLAEHVATFYLSDVLSGTAPVTRDGSAHSVVFQEPLGVVLGISPWNAPVRQWRTGKDEAKAKQWRS